MKLLAAGVACLLAGGVGGVWFALPGGTSAPAPERLMVAQAPPPAAAPEQPVVGKAAGTSAPTWTAPTPAPVSLAAVFAGETKLRNIAMALDTVDCTLTSADVSGDGVVITGLSGAGAPQNALIHALAKVDPGASATWRLATFDSLYCGALNLLRPLSPGLKIAEVHARARLVDDDRIRLGLTLPAFPAYVYLDYFASDGSVYHMIRATSDGGRQLPAGARLTLGEPQNGFTGWHVGPPYGKDMIIAVAASVPLFSPNGGPDSEPVVQYLPKLQAALDSARKRGVSLSGTAMLLETAPRP